VPYISALDPHWQLLTHLFVFWLTSLTQTRCDRVDDGTTKVVAAVGESFENALAACVYHARDIVQAHETQRGSKLDLANAQTLAGDVRSDWMEDWHDGLGFCKIRRHHFFFLMNFLLGHHGAHAL